MGFAKRAAFSALLGGILIAGSENEAANVGTGDGKDDIISPPV
jgi:hypothetical protein